MKCKLFTTSTEMFVTDVDEKRLCTYDAIGHIIKDGEGNVVHEMEPSHTTRGDILTCLNNYIESKFGLVPAPPSLKRLEWSRHAEPHEFLPPTTPCHKIYAIYADYDAEAPTTADLILCKTEEVAQSVVDILNKNPRAYNDLAYVEGYEGCKSFAYHVVYLPSLDGVHATVEDAMGTCVLEEDEDEGVARYEVYAIYNTEVPATDLFFCATEEVAQGVVGCLNDPLRNNLRQDSHPGEIFAYVDGFEGCKSFAYRTASLSSLDDVHTTVESAMGETDRGDEDD